MNFSTKEVEEKVIVSGGQYIRPGIQEVIISGIEGGQTPTGTPYLEIGMYKVGSNVDTHTNLFKLYMSEASQKMSMEKVNHIGTKCVKKALLDSIEADTLEDYGAALNKILKGKSLRMKFCGEEYMNSKGEKKDKASIGLPTFAEALESDAEYPVIEVSKLVYNPDNKYDFKKLPIQTNDVPVSGTSTSEISW